MIMATAASSSSAESFIQEFFPAESRVLDETRSHLTVAQATEATALLATAKRVFVCAKRTLFPSAFMMNHLLHKARPDVVLMDGVGEAPESSLEDISRMMLLSASLFRLSTGPCIHSHGMHPRREPE